MFDRVKTSTKICFFFNFFLTLSKLNLEEKKVYLSSNINNNFYFMTFFELKRHRLRSLASISFIRTFKALISF